MATENKISNTEENITIVKCVRCGNDYITEQEGSTYSLQATSCLDSMGKLVFETRPVRDNFYHCWNCGHNWRRR